MSAEVSGPAFVRTSPAPRPAPARSALARALYLALAGLSLCLAVAGVFLPGLPSTEFVLLASWAAARGSPRLHRWLHTHRWFGPLLNNWHDGRRVPRRAKVMATVSMSACVVLMLFTLHQAWIIGIATACMAAVLVWLWRRPEPLAHPTDTSRHASRHTALLRFLRNSSAWSMHAKPAFRRQPERRRPRGRFQFPDAAGPQDADRHH